MGNPYVLDQGIDATTWQALGLVLTLGGLAVSVLVWRRAGAGRGLRAVAWSLLPLAAGLTGLLRLGWEILDSLLRWATRLVFSPLVWLGVAVAVVALLLHVAGGVLLRRGSGTTGAGEQAVQPTGVRDRAPSLPASATPAASPRRTRKPAQGEKGLVEDQDDIEAILRKHGIS